MTAMSRRGAVAALAAASVAPLGAFAHSRGPLKMIVPTDPGSVLDIIARTSQVELSKALGGQPVVVENHPAAGGTIGTSLLTRSAPDGNTIALVSNSHVINQSVFPNLPYHALKDVTAISMLGIIPLVLLANPKNSTAANARDFAQYLKSNAGQLNYASSGNGTITHLAAQMYADAVGVKIQHVPYKGVSPMLNSVMTGETAFGVIGIAAAQGFIQSGALRPIVVSGGQRLPSYPQLQTWKESDYPGADVSAWLAVLGPVNLPQAEAARLNDAFRKAFATRALVDAMAKQQNIISPTTPEAAAEFLARENERYAVLIKAAGLRVE